MEFAGLVRETGRLWARRLPLIGAWLCLGWVGRELLLQVAVMFGSRLLPALLCLVLGMLVWVVCIVMMLHTLTDDLVCLDRVDADPSVPPVSRLSRRHVMMQAVVAFLAVYAVWGLTDQYVRAAFSANIIYHGADAENFSITFAAWPFYLVVAIIMWVAQRLLRMFLERRRAGGSAAEPGVGWALLMTFLRGMAIITIFMGVSELVTLLQNWAMTRQFWVWGSRAWEGLLALLPQWNLPWDLTVPETVRAAGQAVWTVLAPGFLDAVLLPLVWLSLTAMVVGWSDFTHGVAHGRLAGVVSSGAQRVGSTRLGSTVAASSDLTPLGLVRLWSTKKVEDLLPAVQALRLILRAGLGFLGAYVVAGVLVRALETWVTYGLLWTFGSRNFGDSLRVVPIAEFAGAFVAWTLAACLYVVAFDRAMLRALSPSGSQSASSGRRPTTSRVTGNRSRTSGSSSSGPGRTNSPATTCSSPD